MGTFKNCLEITQSDNTRGQNAAPQSIGTPHASSCAATEAGSSGGRSMIPKGGNRFRKSCSNKK
jgi:hypothetical protein